MKYLYTRHCSYICYELLHGYSYSLFFFLIDKTKHDRYAKIRQDAHHKLIRELERQLEDVKQQIVTMGKDKFVQQKLFTQADVIKLQLQNLHQTKILKNMKNQKSILIILFVSILSFSSCKDDDDASGNPATAEQTNTEKLCGKNFIITDFTIIEKA